MTSTPDAELLLELPAPIDLAMTLAPVAHGHGDPAIRIAADGVCYAVRTSAGPATLYLRAVARGRVHARAWGRGSDAALAAVGQLIGLDDRPGALTPRHAVLADLVRRLPGLRLPRTRRPFEALLSAILEQKVTGVEARAAYRALVRQHGDRAPGPFGLRLAPTPERLAALPYHAYHPLGIERRRAEVIRAAARYGARLSAAPSAATAYRILAALPGIGPWTMAEVGRVAYGDPDAVSVGDYHIPSVVAWALAGERHADDARMLTLLEPYRGQRGRVQRLLEAGGIFPPRRGPRTVPRRIASL